jgi:hypothetical protein
MLAVDIYGSIIYTPDDILETLVEGYGLPREEQYWKRKELPSFFDDIDYDKDGNAILNHEQQAYASIEVERCKKGYYLYIDGKLTYITGKYYFYIQWWKLEDDIYPDYRSADRRYFLFLDHWENVLWCLGIGRGKKRREGASSQSTSNLIYECIFFTSSNCGLVSKTQVDSRDTFTDMAAFGYHQLPVFLKPRQLNRADSVTELVFAAKIVKGEGAGKKGLRSKINYRAPVENAYDRGRMTRVLGDEGGKWPIDVKFSKFISKVSKTLVKGAKRVGFAECPSTVNEMTKGGGAEFKIFWDGANQFKSGGKKTPNRFVTYFTPAYDNYEGFIDKFGESVIDAPTEEQYKYLVEKWVVKDPITGETVSEISEEDIKLGAKAYIYSRRVGLTGELLEEEIRQNPCTVQEMFEAANTDCAFNSYNINKRKKELEDNPVFKRKVLFYEKLDGTVDFRDINKDEESFHWAMTSFGRPELANKFEYYGKLKKPSNEHDGAISVDSYSNSQGGRKYGSKASAWIGRKFDVLDPENTGRPIGHLYGRPKDKDLLHQQVLLAARYFGYKAYYEHTADDYESFFRKLGYSLYLGIYPLSLIDPTKRENADRHKGVPITPFSLSKQMDGGIAYFNNHCGMIDYIELLENALIFDPYNRTAFDTVVSFLILIAVLTEPVYKPPPPPDPLIKMYGDQKQKYVNPALAEY